MDPLSSLLGRQGFSARMFFHGEFCDANRFRQNGVGGHLHLVRQGLVEFLQDDGSLLRIDQPALVFYPRGTSHVLRVPAGHSATLLCADVTFGEGAANPLLRFLPDCLHLPLGEIAGIEATLALLFGEAAGIGEGRALIVDRLCDVLLVQVIRREFAAGRLSQGLLAGLADRHLALALEAIHTRPQERWTLPALASLAGMSRAAFADHFHDVVGSPPATYLARWRIALGCRLLREGLPVKLVSSQAGYTSPSTFTRAFTAQMGVAPRDWLRQAA